VDNSDLDLQSATVIGSKQPKFSSRRKRQPCKLLHICSVRWSCWSGERSKSDTISSGTSAITFITSTDMTTISLSEVDVTKIKMGNKAVLTFDAISGLSIAGQVTEI